MPAAEAKACFTKEECLFAQHDPETDLRWLARMAAWCERYSPFVGWKTIGQCEFHPARPDALFLDIQGIGALFGGDALLAESLLGDMKQRGFRPRIGVADTLGAAWAATYQRSEIAVIPCLAADTVLDPLPVATLRLSDDQLEKLHALGIATVGQLRLLPRASLAVRFGDSLLWRLGQALGEVDEVIEPHKPPAEFFAQWPLEHPSERREELEWILGELLSRLTTQLIQCQRGALQLVGRLDAVAGRPTHFQAGLYRPTACAKHLWELVALQLERLQVPEAVGRVSLAIPRTAAVRLRQGSLFDNQRRHQDALALLMDRLSSRLGSSSVLRVQLRADPLPERAVELRPVSEARSSRQTTAARPPLPAHRPLVLVAPPVKLDVLAVHPDGPPLRFEYLRRLHDVVRHWGPERIESGWWRKECVRRDYYRVETRGGARFWLFRELRQGQWFLHGVFE